MKEFDEDCQLYFQIFDGIRKSKIETEVSQRHLCIR